MWSDKQIWELWKLYKWAPVYVGAILVTITLAFSLVMRRAASGPSKPAAEQPVAASVLAIERAVAGQDCALARAKLGDVEPLALNPRSRDRLALVRQELEKACDGGP